MRQEAGSTIKKETILMIATGRRLDSYGKTGKTGSQTERNHKQTGYWIDMTEEKESTKTNSGILPPKKMQDRDFE